MGDVLPSGPAGPQFSVDQDLEVCSSEALLPIWIFVYWVGSGELASALATTSSRLPFSESTWRTWPIMLAFGFLFELEPEEQCEYF